ncbi:MAG: hypothetical protein J0J01_09155 [Reyranella sp.]|uniref:hypothetical protein n=1 Tax=Reyranella sp. TaxID=1929291 RepID=UPI001ACA6956|nr:hypothetical protein [Reyranella sp.]MBN9087062.1 hypothetical protein [Reyranella sp.]
MKRTLLTIALVAAAGTAGAQTVSTPATGGVDAGAGAGAAATMTAPPAGGDAQMNSNTQMNTNAQMPAGQTNGNMGTNMGAGANANTNMANAPAERLTGAAGTAQKRIEQDGYKGVQNLQKGADGLWRGDAMRGNAKVQVTVDRAGRVSAQ